MAIGGDNTFLPREIIINILKRLPVKSLLRFRAVCKDWRNLLKSPSFIAEHYHHSAHKNPLIFYASGCNRRFSSLCLLRYKMETIEVERMPDMDSLRRVRGIIGSSNGLLCVILCCNGDGSPPSLLLLNPATKEVRQVPTTTNDDGGYCIFGRGFGFSPVVNDYKIVRIHRAEINSQINLDTIWVDGVEVYSLRMGSWKEVEFGVIRSVKLQSKPVTVNGAIFWLGLKTKDHRLMIVSFDIAMEVFKLIPIPSSTSDSHTHLCVLDVYQNKLAMLQGHYVNKSYFIDLWVLEEGSGAYRKSQGWAKKYSIGPTLRSLYPICFWRNEIVCQHFGCVGNNELEDDSAFHLFNLTANNELKRFLVSLSVDDVGGIFSYVESLVSMCDTHVESLAF